MSQPTQFAAGTTAPLKGGEGRDESAVDSTRAVGTNAVRSRANRNDCDSHHSNHHHHHHYKKKGTLQCLSDKAVLEGEQRRWKRQVQESWYHQNVHLEDWSDDRLRRGSAYKARAIASRVVSKTTMTSSLCLCVCLPREEWARDDEDVASGGNLGEVERDTRWESQKVFLWRSPVLQPGDEDSIVHGLGTKLQEQYATLSRRQLRVDLCSNPRVEEVTTALNKAREHAGGAGTNKVIFHYLSHGMPRPRSGHIYLFNNSGDPVKYSLSNLHMRVGLPLMFIADCPSAGSILKGFLGMWQEEEKQQQQQFVHHRFKAGRPYNPGAGLADIAADVGGSSVSSRRDVSMVHFQNYMPDTVKGGGARNAGVPGNLTANTSVGGGLDEKVDRGSPVSSPTMAQGKQYSPQHLDLLQQAQQQQTSTSQQLSQQSQLPSQQTQHVLADQSAREQLLMAARKDFFFIGACQEGETLPLHPKLPTDILTSCLTTPVRMAILWFIADSDSLVEIHPLLLHVLPGALEDKKTPLGQLQWAFTCITECIAWSSFSQQFFAQLYREDVVVSPLFRGYLLAERIVTSLGGSLSVYPPLPGTAQSPLWSGFDNFMERVVVSLIRTYRPPPATRLSTLEFREWMDADAAAWKASMAVLASREAESGRGLDSSAAIGEGLRIVSRSTGCFTNDQMDDAPARDAAAATLFIPPFLDEEMQDVAAKIESVTEQSFIRWGASPGAGLEGLPRPTSIGSAGASSYAAAMSYCLGRFANGPQLVSEDSRSGSSSSRRRGMEPQGPYSNLYTFPLFFRLPVLLQGLLVLSHRDVAMQLTCRFVDVGSLAVSQCAEVNLFNMALIHFWSRKDLRYLRPALLFVYAKALYADPSLIGTDAQRDVVIAACVETLQNPVEVAVSGTASPHCGASPTRMGPGGGGTKGESAETKGAWQRETIGDYHTAAGQRLLAASILVLLSMADDAAKVKCNELNALSECCEQLCALHMSSVHDGEFGLDGTGGVGSFQALSLFTPLLSIDPTLAGRLQLILAILVCVLVYRTNVEAMMVDEEAEDMGYGSRVFEELESVKEPLRRMLVATQPSVRAAAVKTLSVLIANCSMPPALSELFLRIVVQYVQLQPREANNEVRLEVIGLVSIAMEYLCRSVSAVMTRDELKKAVAAARQSQGTESVASGAFPSAAAPSFAKDTDGLGGRRTQSRMMNTEWRDAHAEGDMAPSPSRHRFNVADYDAPGERSAGVSTSTLLRTKNISEAEEVNVRRIVAFVHFLQGLLVDESVDVSVHAASVLQNSELVSWSDWKSYQQAGAETVRNHAAPESIPMTNSSGISTFFTSIFKSTRGKKRHQRDASVTSAAGESFKGARGGAKDLRGYAKGRHDDCYSEPSSSIPGTSLASKARRINDLPILLRAVSEEDRSTLTCFVYASLTYLDELLLVPHDDYDPRNAVILEINAELQNFLFATSESIQNTSSVGRADETRSTRVPPAECNSVALADAADGSRNGKPQKQHVDGPTDAQRVRSSSNSNSNSNSASTTAIETGRRSTGAGEASGSSSTPGNAKECGTYPSAAGSLAEAQFDVTAEKEILSEELGHVRVMTFHPTSNHFITVTDRDVVQVWQYDENRKRTSRPRAQYYISDAPRRDSAITSSRMVQYYYCNGGSHNQDMTDQSDITAEDIEEVSWQYSISPGASGGGFMPFTPSVDGNGGLATNASVTQGSYRHGTVNGVHVIDAAYRPLLCYVRRTGSVGILSDYMQTEEVRRVSSFETMTVFQTMSSHECLSAYHIPALHLHVTGGHGLINTWDLQCEQRVSDDIGREEGLHGATELTAHPCDPFKFAVGAGQVYIFDTRTGRASHTLPNPLSLLMQRSEDGAAESSPFGASALNPTQRGVPMCLHAAFSRRFAHAITTGYGPEGIVQVWDDRYAVHPVMQYSVNASVPASHDGGGSVFSPSGAGPAFRSTRCIDVHPYHPQLLTLSGMSDSLSFGVYRDGFPHPQRLRRVVGMRQQLAMAKFHPVLASCGAVVGDRVVIFSAKTGSARPPRASSEGDGERM